jgi:hypothetical protein
MLDAHVRQQILDEEHLRLLSIFYYVSAGTTGFFSLFGALYVLMGVLFVASSSSFKDTQGNAPPAVMGWILMLLGGFVVVLFVAMAGLKLYAGRCIRARRRRVLCMIVGGVSCLGIPFGTILGIFTFMVLQRPSVIALYAPPAQPDAPLAPAAPPAPPST